MSTKRKVLATSIVVFLLAGFIFTFIKTYSISNVVKLQDQQNERILGKLRNDWQRERQPKVEAIEELKFILEKQEKELQRLDESWERKINSQKLNFSLSYIEEIEQDCREGSPSCEERKKNIPPKTSIIPHAEASDLIVDTNKMVEPKIESKYTTREVGAEELNKWFKSIRSPMIGYAQNFLDNGIKYKVDPIFVLCITVADSSAGRELKSKNNVGNIGNTDSGAVREFDSLDAGIEAMFQTVNNKYLGSLTKIGHFSNGGRKVVKDAPVPQIYASSQDNWNRNVIGCMNEFYTGIDEHYNVRK